MTAGIQSVTTRADACECSATRPPAVLVFHGRNVTNEPLLVPGSGTVQFGGNRRVCFDVESVERGPATLARVCVVTGSGSGDCGFHFEVGKRYAVYAHPAALEIAGTPISVPDVAGETGICDQTRRLEDPRRGRTALTRLLVAILALGLALGVLQFALLRIGVQRWGVRIVEGLAVLCIGAAIGTVAIPRLFREEMFLEVTSPFRGGCGGRLEAVQVSLGTVASHGDGSYEMKCGDRFRLSPAVELYCTCVVTDDRTPR